MRVDRRLPDPRTPDPQRDPREGQGAEVIDLATRTTLPTVSQRRPGREGLGLFAGVVVVGIIGLGTLWSLDSSRQSQRVPSTAGTVPAPAPALVPQVFPPSPIPAAGPARTAFVTAPQPGLASSPAGNPAGAPTVVFDAGVAPQAGYAPQGPSIGPAAPGAAPSTATANEDFASRLGGTGGGSAVAAANFDPRTTVTQGTLIPAILETAIDTDVPGFVRAVVSADVRSFDGTQVLVPRSSRLIGQYRSGVQAGQKRAYVIWTRLIRPDGVSVNIASPAIAFSGETGLSGRVNSHFFERFGSAMLLSVVGGLSALGSGGTSIVVAGGGQSAAAAAVGQSGQIGPTIRVRQGQPIRVFTARDLDFSKVANP